MIRETCQELVNHFSLSFSMLVLQFELTLPGENVMNDGMPGLEDYDDVVTNILVVDGLPQNRGSLHVHLLLYSAAQC